MLELIFVRNNLKITFFLLLVLFMPVQLIAQTAANPAPAASEPSKKKIYIQFENELVDGQRDTPSMDYFFIRKEANYKKMMKLRDSFIPEIKKGKRDFSGSK